MILCLIFTLESGERKFIERNTSQNKYLHEYDDPLASKVPLSKQQQSKKRKHSPKLISGPESASMVLPMQQKKRKQGTVTSKRSRTNDREEGAESEDKDDTEETEWTDRGGLESMISGARGKDHVRGRIAALVKENGKPGEANTMGIEKGKGAANNNQSFECESEEDDEIMPPTGNPGPRSDIKSRNMAIGFAKKNNEGKLIKMETVHSEYFTNSF